PAELLPRASALLGDLQTLGGDSQHVGLAVHVDLALQGLLELGSHVTPQLIFRSRRNARVPGIPSFGQCPDFAPLRGWKASFSSPGTALAAARRLSRRGPLQQ